MSRAALALLCVLAAAPAAAAHDALAALDACIARLDPELDVGYAKIAARCPDLGPALAQSPWAAWLPGGWQQADDGLSADGLRQMRTLIVRESGRAAPAREPAVSSLAAVLASLAPSPQAQSGWWERFKAWLRAILTPPPEAARAGWLERLLGTLTVPHALAGLVSVAALAALALLVLLIVVSELRAAGVTPAWARRAARAGAVGAARPGERAGWPLIERADPAQRPRLLLELIAARLASLERLPPARALTLRELQRAARLPDPADRARLAALAAACERLSFAAQRPRTADLTAALAGGRELLAALESTAAAA
jgi:hypothetical protein